MDYVEAEILDLASIIVRINWSDSIFSLVDFEDFDSNDLIAYPENGTETVWDTHKHSFEGGPCP